jgi:hypothetical protein
MSGEVDVGHSWARILRRDGPERPTETANTRLNRRGRVDLGNLCLS